jgi:hypothetical protein
LILAGLVAFLGLSGGNTTAGEITLTFTNPTPISMPEGLGPGSPYPSTILVSGMPGTIEHVTVTLHDYFSGLPVATAVAVAGPGGENTYLLSFVGRFSASGGTLTFDDQATEQLPLDGQFSSGTYRPTAYFPFLFPPPAPLQPTFPPTLSVFNDTDPNGVWSLFAISSLPSALPSGIAGGWSLTITTSGSAVPEPSSLALIVAGGVALIWFARGKLRQARMSRIG